jgi:hypothetical protein
MNNMQLFILLEKERAELNRLIDEALKNGTPIAETQEIIDQSKKVDKLVGVMQQKFSGQVLGKC